MCLCIFQLIQDTQVVPAFSISDVVDDDGAAVGRRRRVLHAGDVLGRFRHAALQVLVQYAHRRLVPRVQDPLLLRFLFHLYDSLRIKSNFEVNQ